MKKLRILAAGDLHGSSILAEHLAIKAEKNKADLVVLTGDISSPFRKESIMSHFKKRNLEVIFVPGNWDMDLDVRFFRDFYNIKNIDGYYFRRDGIDFIGIGSKDFKLDHKKEDFLKIKKIFDKIKKDKTKKVLVSHLHPINTKAEFSGIKGSYFLRKLIDEISPDVALSSHIHEAEGLEEKIGKTKFFVVGKRGKIIEI